MNPNPNDINEDDANAAFYNASPQDLYQRARRFSDVMDEIDPQGEFIPMANLLDREIVIRSIRFANTKKGPAAFPACVNAEGEIFHTFTASKVLVPKLQSVVDHLPILVRFVDREGGAFGHFYDIE